MRNLEGIATSRGPSSRRLAATYAEMRLRRATGWLPQRARLLDWEMVYVDYAALVTLFEEIFVRRQYPFQPQRAKPFVVDCGANVGVATLYFKTLAPDADVLAFEPEPTAFRLLEENVRQNLLADVECVPVALARECGVRTLRTFAPAHGGASLEFDGAGWSATEVEVVRLSDRIGARRVDFLKLDVEGSEAAILDDLIESAVIRQVDEIVLEHHPRRAADLASLLGTLADSGFEYRIAVAGDHFWEPGQLLVLHAFRASAIS
jgi:FkbM family methyltransferase